MALSPVHSQRKDSLAMAVVLALHQLALMMTFLLGMKWACLALSLLLLPLTLVLPMRFWVIVFMGSMFLYVKLTSTMLISDLAGLIMVSIYWANYLLREHSRLEAPPLLKSVCFFLVAIGMSLIDTKLLGLATVHYFRYVFLFVTFYTLHHAFLHDIRIRTAFNWYMFFSVLAALSMIFDIIRRAGVRTFGIAGTLFNDMLVGANIMAVGYLLMDKDRFWTRISLAGFLFLSLVLTQTRGAWLSFSLTSVFMLIMIAQKEKNFFTVFVARRLFPILIIAIIIVGIGFTFIPEVQFSAQQRVSEAVPGKSPDQGGITSFMTRLFIWHTAIRTFEANPINGIGVDMFNFLSGEYYTIHPLLWDYYVRELDPHLILLQFLCETGIIGFTGLLVLYFNMFRLALRNYRNAQNPEDSTESLIILCSLFFVLVSSCYAGSWSYGQNSYQFMIYLAACSAFSIKLKRQNESS
jgi:O-antigen ligase